MGTGGDVAVVTRNTLHETRSLVSAVRQDVDV